MSVLRHLAAIVVCCDIAMVVVTNVRVRQRLDVIAYCQHQLVCNEPFAHKVESNGTYMLAIRKSLDHAWKYTRDAETGLFFKQFSGNEITDNPGDILDQGAIVELYAKLAVN